MKTNVMRNLLLRILLRSPFGAYANFCSCKNFWTLLALTLVVACAFEPGARAQLFESTGVPSRAVGLRRKVEAPSFRRRQVSVFRTMHAKFSMKQAEPPKRRAVVNSLAARLEKSDLDEVLGAVNVAANVGPLLDLSLRYPSSVFDPERLRGPMRIGSEKFVNATMSIALGEGWTVRSGFNMDGWYDPGVNAKISDALMKLQPQEVLRYAGYAPVVGLEKRVWRLRFGFLYGVRPKKSGVSIYSADPARQQLRISASMML